MEVAKFVFFLFFFIFSIIIDIIPSIINIIPKIRIIVNLDMILPPQIAIHLSKSYNIPFKK